MQSIGDFRKKMKEVEDDRKKEDRKRKREQSLEDAQFRREYNSVRKLEEIKRYQEESEKTL